MNRIHVRGRWALRGSICSHALLYWGWLLPVSLLALLSAATVLAAEPPEVEAEFSEATEKDWAVEVVTAENLVKELRAKQPADPTRLAEALAALGNAQLGARNYEAAEASFLESLRLLDQHTSNPAAREYLQPLEGLGTTLARTKRYPQAMTHLERALQVAHRSYGLLDPRQETIREELANTLVALGRPADGERHIKYLQTIGERMHGARDPDLAPVLCRIAEWYNDAGNYFTARATLRNAIDIVERSGGKNHPALVQPLRGLAASYTHQVNRPPKEKTLETAEGPSSGPWESLDHAANPRTLPGEGDRALRRAVEILEHDPSADPKVLIETLLQLGDWYQIKHQSRRAIEYYKQAWQVAQRQGKSPAILRFPVQVYYTLPPSSIRNASLPDAMVDVKYVQVEFTVTPEGLVEDAHVSDSTASSRLASQTVRAIQNARFRPKFEEGEPTATQAVRWRLTFRVRKQEEAELETAS